MYRRIGEYISLELLCFVSLTSGCSLIPIIMICSLSLTPSPSPPIFHSIRHCVSALARVGAYVCASVSNYIHMWLVFLFFFFFCLFVCLFVCLFACFLLTVSYLEP